MNWKSSFETSPLTSPKDEYKSNDITVNEKHIGIRKHPQLTRTSPVAEMIMRSWFAGTGGERVAQNGKKTR